MLVKRSNRSKASVGRAATLLGAIALAVPVALAGPAAAGLTGPECGATITSNLTLGADLHCPSGNGLVVGAANITIDLGGHTISGSPSGVGVTNTGFSGVTLRNGSITGFGTAVLLTNATDNLVRDVHATLPDGDTLGFRIAGGGTHRVNENTIAGGGTAIELDGSANNQIGSNTITNSTEAISLFGATGNSVTFTTVSGHTSAFALEAGSVNNHLFTNTATNGVNGVYVDGTSVPGTQLWGNRVTGHESEGIELGAGGGTASIIGNTSSHNLAGITVEAPGTTIGSNTADDNGQIGIDAVAGVTDGGRNQASGNPEPQCINVACTGSSAAAHPDATIRKPGGEIVGRSVLHPAGEGQTKHVRALPNGPGKLVVRVHNDHDVAAVFNVSAPESGSQGFRTRFHSHGNDVTRAVRNGTFVASVDPDGVMVLHLTVSARAGTAPGTTGSYFVTVSNLHDGERLDAVRVVEHAV